VTIGPMARFLVVIGFPALSLGPIAEQLFRRRFF
jgi:hypothetical protein